ELLTEQGDLEGALDWATAGVDACLSSEDRAELQRGCPARPGSSGHHGTATRPPPGTRARRSPCPAVPAAAQGTPPPAAARHQRLAMPDARGVPAKLPP